MMGYNLESFIVERLAYKETKYSSSSNTSRFANAISKFLIWIMPTHPQASSIILQARRISFFEIVNGGAILKQCGANKNKSVNTPFSIQRLITFLLNSNDSNSAA